MYNIDDGAGGHASNLLPDQNQPATRSCIMSRRAQKEADPTAQVWDTELSIGATVEGQVHARKEYGVLCDLAAHPDVVGLVMPEQVIVSLRSVRTQWRHPAGLPFTAS